MLKIFSKLIKAVRKIEFLKDKTCKIYCVNMVN